MFFFTSDRLSCTTSIGRNFAFFVVRYSAFCWILEYTSLLLYIGCSVLTGSAIARNKKRLPTSAAEASSQYAREPTLGTKGFLTRNVPESYHLPVNFPVHQMTNSCSNSNHSDPTLGPGNLGEGLARGTPEDQLQVCFSMEAWALGPVWCHIVIWNNLFAGGVIILELCVLFDVTS